MTPRCGTSGHEWALWGGGRRYSGTPKPHTLIHERISNWDRRGRRALSPSDKEVAT